MRQFVDSIELSLQTQNWYAAVTTALILPDIAGWVRFPTQGSGARYRAWFEEFVAPRYIHHVGPERRETRFLSGSDCYALRCALLHEGRGDTSNQHAHDILERFHFIAPTPGMIIHCNRAGAALQLQVDMFCRDICHGIQEWMTQIDVNDNMTRTRLDQLIHIYTPIRGRGFTIGPDGVH